MAEKKPKSKNLKDIVFKVAVENGLNVGVATKVAIEVEKASKKKQNNKGISYLITYTNGVKKGAVEKLAEKQVMNRLIHKYKSENEVKKLLTSLNKSEVKSLAVSNGLITLIQDKKGE